MNSAVNGTYMPWSPSRSHRLTRMTIGTSTARVSSAVGTARPARYARTTPSVTAATWRTAETADQYTVDRTMIMAAHGATYGIGSPSACTASTHAATAASPAFNACFATSREPLPLRPMSPRNRRPSPTSTRTASHIDRTRMPKQVPVHAGRYPWDAAHRARHAPPGFADAPAGKSTTVRQRGSARPVEPDPGTGVETVDAVVIGAGPNGLVAANMLADRGWEVTVLEAADRPGGAVRTEETTVPGFRNDQFSAFYPMAAASPVIAELELERWGLRWSGAPDVLAHLLPDGRAALL